MALITATNLTSGGSTTTGTSFTTASISPSANQLVLISVCSADPTITVSIAGCGLTWVQVSTTVNDQNRITVLRAMGSPSSGALTITSSSNLDRITWSVDQFNNVDTSGTNGSGAIVQSAVNQTNSGTTLTATLATFSSINNATFGATGTNGQSDLSQITPGSGFSELADAIVGTSFKTGIETEFKNTNDTTVDSSWTGSSVRGTIIALEIKFGATTTGGAFLMNFV